MTKAFRYLLVAIWLVMFPIAFAAVWLRTPSLWFINLPESAWHLLARMFGASCCENGADMEVIVGLAFGLVFAVALLALAVALMARLNRMTHRSPSRPR